MFLVRACPIYRLTVSQVCTLPSRPLTSTAGFQINRSAVYQRRRLRTSDERVGMKSVGENKGRRHTSCCQCEQDASAYIMLSVWTRCIGIHHAVIVNERHRHTSSCQCEWEAATYVMPSVYEACTPNNNVRYFVHRTLRWGWAPKCYRILYTFLLLFFFFFNVICFVPKY
jgi:hypothetical protein